MPDVHASLFDYNGIPAYMRLNLGTEMPETYRFQGSKGIIEVTEFSMTYTPQTGEDSGPSYYANASRKPLRDEYMKRWHAEHDPKPGKEPAAGSGRVSQRLIRRCETTSFDILQRGALPQAGNRRCRVRTPRRAGLPHGE